MKKVFFALIILFIGCESNSKFKLVADLPKKLDEVSGVQKVNNSDLLWMHNDGGNSNVIYGVNEKGEVKEKVALKSKNMDWEDITSDEEGNIYIGDFGNNKNDRKNLMIHKIKKEDLFKDKKIKTEKIKFHYPDQFKFPPKKSQFFFDAESFFYLNNFFYVFTKSDVKQEYGRTKMYRIPAVKGDYEAEFIAEFNGGEEKDNRVTAACISPDKQKVALLTHNKVLLFTDFTSDDFFKGKHIKINLNHNSQKEGITFKNNNTLYITDEKNEIGGGNLYEYSLN